MREEKAFKLALEEPEQAALYENMVDNFEFNIVLLGQSRVGKTSLICALKDERVATSLVSSYMHAHLEKEISKHKIDIHDNMQIAVALVSIQSNINLAAVQFDTKGTHADSPLS